MMLHQYFKLLEFVKDDADLEEFLSTPAENRRLRGLLDELRNVKCVSKALQESCVSIADVRLFFDGLVANRGFFISHLGKSAA